ncbi:ZYRO0E05412p [Zygosaccharomyces rouxii]|uniref:ZYRO0E05412p n=1 Tax=Zygosaccharomyces rouxii (strain ATCC 2623 / CBS 732 / NBRC 1130 / NCYC 568 / NRRL Y-229) TaxID=559307 RepID=C5E4F0_ZYGRC|nr:uncharacterized protein ZYRO0E05412g [Zygosaccharomyces rouxii]KAH9198231.1 hypothetical protein LQ764DRAFT_226675 [Zygosaccharomyces rouxii]CAR30911.1 ZYRO0E05412p [Zygosaccharomyces rouxii]
MSADVTVFNNGTSAATDPAAANKMKRKRNRIPLSCTICRKRKVKCDKTRPNCEQCSKTGVAHLCHYMEQTWAEEAEKEISKESELKKLKNRVKALEEALVKAQASSYSQTPDSDTPILEDTSPLRGEPTLSGGGKHDNDELDLTRQFDMLHLRNNGIIHLGATHWLAIMKGDPYLKLLWGHIFTMKEKLAEWYGQKKRNPQAQMGKCPVMAPSVRSDCPVDHRSLRKSESSVMPGKCPVDLTSLQKCPIDRSTMPRAPTESSSASKCPIDHSASTSRSSVDHSSVSKCPVKHEETPLGSPVTKPQTSLPSFQNLTSKCPVIHDALPGIQEAISRNEPAERNAPVDQKLDYSQTMARLCELLPPKRIICMFIEKFFKQIYPVIPILDESTFKNHMNYMLSLGVNTETDNVKHIRMNKLADFCNLGILVIILRLTWWSLPVNGCKIDLGSHNPSFFMPHATTASVTQAKEEAMLANYATPAEALTLVRENLIKFDQISSVSNSNVNLTTVQFSIFYKLYLMCWSNDSGGNGKAANSNNGDNQDNESHQVLFSSIAQMAFSCGLHRDPDNFPQLNSVPYAQTDGSNPMSNNNGVNATGSARPHKDAVASTEKFKHTWRKTWYYIVSLDVQQSLSLGTPRLLRNLNDFSDTKLPTASKLDYVSDIKELVIVKNTTLFFQIDLCIIAVLNHVLNVSVARNVKKSQLDFLISSLGDLTNNKRNICEVLNGLINNGMLHSSEGTVDNDMENIYGLPSLEELLSQQTAPSSENDVDKRLELAHESTTKALFFSKHLTIRMLLYLLNYVLFTHYEPLGVEDSDNASIAKSYAQETLNYAMDGYRNCLFFFTNVGHPGSSGSMFNYIEVVLAPQCLDIGHRALQFIVCLILRAKCGPLTGMGESAIIGNNNGSAGNSEEEDDRSNWRKKEGSVDSVDDRDDEISLDTGERLADILLSKMILFHKMTKQLCVKYQYAQRTMKSTGFFIALLREPSQKSKRGDGQSGDKKHPKLNKMTGLFRNLPSLILCGDGEQLKRCPVYQDAIGFVTPRTDPGINRQGMFGLDSARSGVQLPPLKAYKPITYVSSSVRTERGGEEAKRRRLNGGPPLSSTDIPLGSMPAVPPITSPRSVPGAPASLPPIDKIAGDLTPGHQPNAAQFGPMDEIDGRGASTFTTPVSEGSLSNFTPTFEDFLMENANFNGIMLNPSSIVEAVGFHNFDGVNMPLGGEPADFLPLDSIGIDGLAEPNGVQFPNMG